MARDLVERAQQLCDSGVAVDRAIDELLELSGRDRLELSAAFALAVRAGGGRVTAPAALLEVAKCESEGWLRSAISDPDRLLGRLVALYARSIGWGALWTVLAVALVVTSILGSSSGWALVTTVLVASFAAGRATLAWYAARRLDPGQMKLPEERVSAVSRLARLVAWRAVALARDEPAELDVESLSHLALGGSDMPLARRRAKWVLREAARDLAMWPGAGGIRRARALVKAAREHTSEDLVGN